MTAQDLITASLVEMGAYAQGEVPSAGDIAFGFDKLNALWDEWSARKPFAYAMKFELFTLVPNLSPHTIGPQGATFTLPQRPERLEGATVVISASAAGPIDVPLALKDAAWWNNQAVKGVTSSVPTALYYEPDWPNGSLFYWPVPSFNYQTRLQFWQSVAQAPSLAAVLKLPPAYYKASKLTLAVEMCETFGKSAGPILINTALRAGKAIGVNNQSSPRIRTQEAGQTGRGNRAADFNWASGQPWGGGS
ncbi:MAG: hypothetical protein WAK20_02620 [Candidatus Acidiferrum sp.]